MTTHRLFIPNWRPVSLNEIVGRNKYAIHRIKKNDREMVGTYAANCVIPKATGKRRVSLEIVLGPRQRQHDPDALFKVLLDSLKQCRRLVDDSPKWCELGAVTYRRDGEPGTTIVLTDCGVEP